MKKILTISLITLTLDQIIKVIINLSMKVNTSLNIIKDFFSITLVYNKGAAFSILEGNRIFLILASILILILIYLFLIKNKKINKIEELSYGLLIGGIIGNLIDRIIYGYVIDYLDFKIFNYNFAVFNLADTAIVISIFLLIITIIKGEKNGSI